MNWTNTIVLGVVPAILVGCSSYKPVLRTDGDEMLDIYRNALAADEKVDDALARLQEEERNAGEGGEKATPSDNAKGATQRGFHTRKLDGPDAAKNQYVMGPNGVPLRFQCGVGGRIQDTPCGSGYGFPKLIERNSNNKKKVSDPTKKDGSGAGLGPITARDVAMIQAANDAAIRSDRTETPASAPARKDKATLYGKFTTTPDTALKQLFPRLPNPDIVVYVTPHLATHNRVPVPGYTTAFPLYDQVHYAMPGEAVTRE